MDMPRRPIGLQQPTQSPIILWSVGLPYPMDQGSQFLANRASLSGGSMRSNPTAPREAVVRRLL